MLRTYDENHCAAYLTKAAVRASKQLLLLGVHPWAFGIARDTGAGEGDGRDTFERGQNRQKGPYLCSESVIIPGTGRCCPGCDREHRKTFSSSSSSKSETCVCAFVSVISDSFR